MRYRDIISEGRVLTAHIKNVGRDVEFPVWVNPISQRMAAFAAKNLRMIVTRSGDLYVWDAMIATHDDIEETFSLNGRFFLSTDAEHIVVSYSSGDPVEHASDEWMHFRNVLRFFGGTVPLDPFLAERFERINT